MRPGTETVIRPAAVLTELAANRILDALGRLDVSRGGVWNVSTTLWQRYNRAWNGPLGTVGDAHLVGSIAVMYGSPMKGQITVYRASITPFGVDTGWSVDSLCDDAFGYAGLTLASCPRASLATPPRPDPFHVPLRA